MGGGWKPSLDPRTCLSRGTRVFIHAFVQNITVLHTVGQESRQRERGRETDRWTIRDKSLSRRNESLGELISGLFVLQELRPCLKLASEGTKGMVLLGQKLGRLRA